MISAVCDTININANHFECLVYVMMIHSWAATKLATQPESEHLLQSHKQTPIQ